MGWAKWAGGKNGARMKHPPVTAYKGPCFIVIIYFPHQFYWDRIPVSSEYCKLYSYLIPRPRKKQIHCLKLRLFFHRIKKLVKCMSLVLLLLLMASEIPQNLTINSIFCSGKQWRKSQKLCIDGPLRESTWPVDILVRTSNAENNLH